VTFHCVADNLRQSFRALANGKPGASVIELPGVSIASLGVTFQMFNAAFPSELVETRAALEERLAKLKAKYQDQGPPRPTHWGGYRVRPDEIEFWQQGEHRLHDRLRYRRRRDGAWRIDRLSP